MSKKHTFTATIQTQAEAARSWKRRSMWKTTNEDSPAVTQRT